MSLAEAFERVTPVAQPHKLCGVTKARQTMSAEDQATLDRLMADGDVQSSMIGRAMRAEGFELRDDTVQRHRRGSCTCERVAA